MYLGIFDSQPHQTVTEKRCAPLNSTAIPFTHLYGGLLKGEHIHPLDYTNTQRVTWKPVQYKDTVTYIRYAI